MKLHFIFVSILTLFSTLTCSYKPQKVDYSLYDLEKNRIDRFNELERSILKLTCSAYYENYYYSSPLKFSDPILQDSLLIDKKFTTNSVAGSGLILSKHGEDMLVITCYHVFDFEDTVKTYYFDKRNQPTKFLQTQAIKYGQTTYVTHKNGTVSRGNIIIKDEKNDIALIETKAIKNTLSELPFQGVISSKVNIKLGKEVYLLGFPKGHLMITKGLASPSKYKNKFMVDVSFNPGFSGGIAILFDTETGNYQYIGMANSTAYDSQIALGPIDDFKNININKNVPYQDDIYIKELKMINYGLTFVIKSDVIVNFLNNESNKLKQLGYSDILNLIE